MGCNSGFSSSVNDSDLIYSDSVGLRKALQPRPADSSESVHGQSTDGLTTGAMKTPRSWTKQKEHLRLPRAAVDAFFPQEQAH